MSPGTTGWTWMLGPRACWINWTDVHAPISVQGQRVGESPPGPHLGLHFEGSRVEPLLPWFFRVDVDAGPQGQLYSLDGGVCLNVPQDPVYMDPRRPCPPGPPVCWVPAPRSSSQRDQGLCAGNQWTRLCVCVCVCACVCVCVCVWRGRCQPPRPQEFTAVPINRTHP